MIGNLSGPTLIVILFIVLLLFGAPKLPALAKSLGQSMKILRKEVSSDRDGSGSDAAPADSATPPAAPPAIPPVPPAASSAPSDPAAPPATAAGQDPTDSPQAPQSPADPEDPKR
ncbi:Sec-independent protein translocase subunit TatA/TatB [Leucobacter chromiiresistens]|uniref:Sec-independent protein translocase subunit TatA/TatB n=1 Tax=Leucobacter chromiiresistens TaxID=1079994 RepID=UPI0009E68ACE|nr:twin-arginine translocase TatA/TatE family subunit [Leucobacter chromiiresistens]